MRANDYDDEWSGLGYSDAPAVRGLHVRYWDGESFGDSAMVRADRQRDPDRRSYDGERSRD